MTRIVGGRLGRPSAAHPGRRHTRPTVGEGAGRAGQFADRGRRAGRAPGCSTCTPGPGRSGWSWCPGGRHRRCSWNRTAPRWPPCGPTSPTLQRRRAAGRRLRRRADRRPGDVAAFAGRAAGAARSTSWSPTRRTTCPTTTCSAVLPALQRRGAARAARRPGRWSAATQVRRAGLAGAAGRASATKKYGDTLLCYGRAP